MKKTIILFISLLLAFSLSGCGQSQNPSGSTTSPNGLTGDSLNSGTPSGEEDNGTSLVFDGSFEFFGYTFGYPSDYVRGQSDGGVTITNGNKFWISVDSPDYYGLDIVVDSLDGIVDKCTEGVCKAMEGRYYDLFSADQTSQNVSSKTEIEVGNTTALKVKGTFQNMQENTSIEYVAVYMTFDLNGSKYPIYMIGIPRDGSIVDVENYMDEAVKHISAN